jgi:chemotaxis protein CheD
VERSAVYLQPGGLLVTPAPTAVTTILGSCVAACLFDPLTRWGGINHFLLPLWPGVDDPSARYGDVALERLVERMRAAGCRSSRLRAKLFGGSRIHGAGPGEDHLGRRNVEVARTVLRAAGIAVAAEDVGGDRGRKLVFQTDDGTAWVRRLG